MSHVETLRKKLPSRSRSEVRARLYEVRPKSEPSHFFLRVPGSSKMRLKCVFRFPLPSHQGSVLHTVRNVERGGVLFFLCIQQLTNAHPPLPLPLLSLGVLL